MSYLIDTNILIYAQGTGTKSEVARQMILAGGVISVQVLNEFAAVLRRKFGFEWEVIAEAIADVRTALDPVRPIDVVAHTEAVSLPHAHGFSARAPSCG
jgi:predicted nucleic acid-binding protein